MRKSYSTLEPEISVLEIASIHKALSLAKLKGIHLEIGTAAGGTLCNLISFYKKTQNFSPEFWVIDTFTYFRDQFDIVSQNLANHNIDTQEITFHKCKSSEAFHGFLNKEVQFDFILIDGSHKIKYVTQDLRWTRFLNQGGLLCLHDFSTHHPGVYLSVRRFLKNYPNFQVKSHVESMLILEKKYKSPTLEITSADLIWSIAMSPLLQLKKSCTKRIKRILNN